MTVEFLLAYVPLLPTVHSRAESRTSMSSVNTIEDINMGFEMAIMAGEQTMGDIDNQSEPEGITV